MKAISDLESLLDFIWSQNTVRRHLPPGQVAAIYIKRQLMSENWARHREQRKARADRRRSLALVGNRNAALSGKKGNGRVSCETPLKSRRSQNWERDEFAKGAGVSAATAQRALEVQRKAPDLLDQVAVGRLSLQTARREIQKRERMTELELAAADLVPDPKSFDVFRADLGEGLPQVPDESVDVIVTDPPYAAEFVPVFADLARVAARVLKPGGSLLAMVGKMYLPETLNLLCQNLKYHWEIAYIVRRRPARSWNRRITIVSKSILWFVKVPTLGRGDGM